MSTNPLHPRKRIPGEIIWDPKEREVIESRILALRKDQIAALLNLCGFAFRLRDIEDVVNEIVIEGHKAVHLDILMTEARSKEDLIGWIELFEKYAHRP